MPYIRLASLRSAASHSSRSAVTRRLAPRKPDVWRPLLASVKKAVGGDKDSQKALWLLKSIRQRGKRVEVSDYSQDFLEALKSLTSVVCLPSALQVHLYTRGLNPMIRSRLRKSGAEIHLQDTIRQAVSIGLDLDHKRHEKLQAMEIDYIPRNTPGKGHRHKDEMVHCMKHGKCLVCLFPGHKQGDLDCHYKADGGYKYNYSEDMVRL